MLHSQNRYDKLHRVFIGPHVFTKMSAFIEELCQAVPVLLWMYSSSWRENSCDSDPGGGERSHQNTARLHGWKRKPWDITVQCRWCRRQTETKLTSLAGIVTLSPINASLITYFSGLKESTVTGENTERDSWDIVPQGLSLRAQVLHGVVTSCCFSQILQRRWTKSATLTAFAHKCSDWCFPLLST